VEAHTAGVSALTGASRGAGGRYNRRWHGHWYDSGGGGRGFTWNPAADIVDLDPCYRWAFKTDIHSEEGLYGQSTQS